MKWFVRAITQDYATFEGRARRKEYWLFVLFYCLTFAVLLIVDGITGLLDKAVGVIGLFSGLFVVATLVPLLAVTVRRLHDTNRSGWWILVKVIPVIGAIVLLVFTVQDSQPGANRFGPNPKGVLGPGTPMPVVVRDWR
jgi:uncharacterized membrane protein YhaH (DUF805 family)